jgi:hypothetical protein
VKGIARERVRACVRATCLYSSPNSRNTKVNAYLAAANSNTKVNAYLPHAGETGRSKDRAIERERQRWRQGGGESERARDTQADRVPFTVHQFT